MTNRQLLLVKLGGSLVTDKSKPLTPRTKLINQLAVEIAQLKAEKPGLKIIIGNGAGSFGHYLVKKYDMATTGDLAGNEGKVNKIHQSVERLNGLVTSALRDNGLEVEIVNGQQIISNKPLTEGPVTSVYGDIVSENGYYRIISTEELFLHVLPRLRREYDKVTVVFMTSVDGILDADGKVIETIGADDRKASFYETEGFDVTGGMKQKLAAARMIKQWADDVFIIGGTKPGNLTQLLKGQSIGTKVV